MSVIKAFPFLRPAAGRATVLRWLQGTAGEEVLGETLPLWDPATPLDVGADVRLDLAGVFEDCQLAAGDRVRTALTWHCRQTGMRGSGDAIELESSDEPVMLRLGVQIPGELLSFSVRLMIILLLRENRSRTSPLSPHRVGDMLWSAERTVLLEGKSARFPTELIDFREHPWLPDGAGWYLDWDPSDLTLMVLASVRLLINAAHEPVRRAVSGVSADATSRAIVDAIRWDVARTLVAGALSNEAFVQAPEQCEPGSVGAAVRQLINTCFPGYSLSGLRDDWWLEPARNECALQAGLKLFQG